MPRGDIVRRRPGRGRAHKTQGWGGCGHREVSRTIAARTGPVRDAAGSGAGPAEPARRDAAEDRAVKTANFTGTSPVQMPRIARPRTTDNPEADEIWQLTLQEAIRIGLDNSEVSRVISLGAQGIPVGGFE